MTRPRPPITTLARRADVGVVAFDLPADLVAPAKELLAAAQAPNTHAARRSDWAVFTTWCQERGRSALPAGADTVAAFIVDLAHRRLRKAATLRRYLSSIATAHGAAGQPNPVADVRVLELMKGVRNTLGMKQRLAAPLTRDVLTAIRPHCSARDWAVLGFGQALAARRSELCALDVGDVVLEPRGAVVTIRKSKTDQEARGAVIAVPRLVGDLLCPVAALEAYLAAPRRTRGPLFVGPRSPRLTVKEVDRAVKRAVAAAGFDAKLYSAHSLRAGYVTDARRAGKTWAEIMEHTRHADLRVAKGYARYERDPFAKCVDGR